MSTTVHFRVDDFISPELPAPGDYCSTLTSARFSTSAKGNLMLEVKHKLSGVSPAHEVVHDYFVLEGVSRRGVYMARRRLVELYMACGLEPQDGDEIRAEDLANRQLVVTVEHDEWENQPRLRVVGYQRADQVPF